MMLKRNEEKKLKNRLYFYVKMGIFLKSFQIYFSFFLFEKSKNVLLTECLFQLLAQVLQAWERGKLSSCGCEMLARNKISSKTA